MLALVGVLSFDRPLRESVRLADLVCQAANGCRRIPERVPGVFASRELCFCTLFGLFDSGHQIIAIRSFSAIPHVVGTYSLEEPLYLVSLLTPIMVLLVQNQPEFKAWIRAGDMNAAVCA